MGKEAFLRASLFFVATTTAERNVGLELRERVEERDRLQPVAARVRPLFLLHPTGVDRILHQSHVEYRTRLLDQYIAEFERLREVVTGVDVDEGERDPGRREGLPGQVDHQNRVLPAGKEQDGTLELGCHFPHEEDGLGFELVDVVVRSPHLDRSGFGVVAGQLFPEKRQSLTNSAPEIHGWLPTQDLPRD